MSSACFYRELSSAKLLKNSLENFSCIMQPPVCSRQSHRSLCSINTLFCTATSSHFHVNPHNSWPESDLIGQVSAHLYTRTRLWSFQCVCARLGDWLGDVRRSVCGTFTALRFNYCTCIMHTTAQNLVSEQW